MAEISLWVPDSVAVTETAKPTDKLESLAESLNASGMTLTDLLLGMDTVGFQRLGQSMGDYLDLQPPAREALVKRSRLYFQMEPLADRILTMWTEYAFGRGWDIHSDDEGMQALLDTLLESRHNKRQFRRSGWMRNSNALLVDGERWFGFWPKAEMRTRNFEPLEMAEILTNPEDKDEIWYYRRTWRDMGGTLRTRFYRDWDYSGNEQHPRMNPNALSSAVVGETSWQPEPDVFVTYVAINSLGLRGYPLLTSSFDWIREHREFMADRASLSHARAQFAWKGTVKGGQRNLNAIASAFEQPQVNSPEEGLRTSRASTWWQNDGVDLQQVSMQTDGASAANDQRAFRGMGSLPGGLPDFLLGDTGQANLATATATERPLETMFSSYQGVWVEFIEDMAEHVAEWNGFSGDPQVVVDPPSILAKQPWEMARAYGELVRNVPAIGAAPQPIQMLLNDIGVEDVEGAMDIITPLLGLEPTEDEDVAASLEAVREAFRGD